MLASLLYPYDDDAKNKIDGWLTQLASEGCIARYEVDGTSYIQVAKWADHQKIDKPSPSRLPVFVEASRSLAKGSEASPMDLGPRTVDLGMEGNGGEGTDSGTPEPGEPPAIGIPLIDGTDHAVTNADVCEWVTAYPGVDVMQQLREMRTWCKANPTNRKTPRGINAFIVKWLGREQDKGGLPSLPNKQQALEDRNRAVARKWAEDNCASA
jgi:hypothetical protein